MTSIIWDKRAIPVCFDILPKLGSSNLEEQKTVISNSLAILKNYQVCILGDREFCSISLANWLAEKNLGFCLRMKKNTNIEIKQDIWSELSAIGLRSGTSVFYQGVKLTKSTGFQPVNLACKWKKKVKGVTPKEGWFIATNFPSLEIAINAYKQRFDIEEMFKDLKSGGYNLEDSSACQTRLISLIILITIAYTSASLQGKSIKLKGVQEYVCRPKENGRQVRRHSSFYVGIYGQTWVDFKYKCTDLVTELIKLNRNKWKFYRRGERAMMLIESAL
ncbi:transposase [Calothrix sp. NIES-3974]|nr:transposase [Calothrix sp. NIES-3974]